MKTLHPLAIVAFALALFAIPALAADPTPSPSPAAKQYICTMCQVVKDAPGKCPLCHMKLVEKKAAATTASK